MVLDVLIVEDHEHMRALLSAVLTRAGARVRELSNASDALAEMRAGAPDILLCDQSMPGMSGLDLVRALRADPSHARTRIVMVSGHTGSQFAAAALTAGADAVLEKPIAPHALLATIARLMSAAA